MPRTFPSQIVAFLTHHFHNKGSVAIPGEKAFGTVAALLELYDSLPPELIALPPDDYARLVAAIATIRLGIDHWRQTREPKAVKGLSDAVREVWGIIEKLKDSVPSTNHDLNFISDPVLREMIGLDISAVATDLQSGEWKSATIIAGSCCEALLLFGLQAKEARAPGTIATAVGAITWPGSAPPAGNLTHRSWDLFSYTEVASKIKLIGKGTKTEFEPAREYRNLIHPAKTMRDKIRLDRGTAYVAAGALEHVISDLRKNL
jgi:hypothetical protein